MLRPTSVQRKRCRPAVCLHDAKGARIVGAPFRLSWNRSDRWAVYRIEALTVKAVIIMRGTLIAAIAACFAVLILAGARPALSMPATAAVHYGETHAGVLQEVGKRYSRNWHRRPYYRGYAYGYQPYGWYRPYSYYYRPYAYYDYPYYYRRPGISLWFGF